MAAAGEAVAEGVVAGEDRDQAGLVGPVKVEVKAGLQLSKGDFGHFWLVFYMSRNPISSQP